jgi:hypothetical protein
MKYAMTEVSGHPELFVALMGALVVLTGIFLIFWMVQTKYANLELTDSGLRVNAFLYGTKLDYSDLAPEKARVVDMDADGISIDSRLNGTAVKGLHVGWFSGKTGKMKLYVTDRKSVLEIPTKKGYTLYFSSKDAAAILAQIREKAGR